MSSPQASSDQNEATDEAPVEEDRPSASEASETAIETIECPNCGHKFTGNYCPECGQEADPSATVVEVIGGFFRELVDLEHGFWPTFVGLTLRPGAVLRDYLSGVRAGLISPGRYLLAAVVVSVGVDQFLAWIGAKDIPWADSAPASSANVGAETVRELGHVAGGAMRTIFVGPQTRIVGALLGAGLLTLLLYRLFEDELSRMAEALATGSFLISHAIFLAGGASLLYVGAASLYAGHPVSSPMYLSVAIGVGYIGLASYQAFGPGWKPALKGMFAGIWTIVETVSVGMAGAMAYGSGLILMDPDRYAPSGHTLTELVGIFLLIGLLAAIPLLLHAGVELYTRHRS